MYSPIPSIGKHHTTLTLMYGYYGTNRAAFAKSIVTPDDITILNTDYITNSLLEHNYMSIEQVIAGEVDPSLDIVKSLIQDNLDSFNNTVAILPACNKMVDLGWNKEIRSMCKARKVTLQVMWTHVGTSTIKDNVNKRTDTLGSLLRNNWKAYKESIDLHRRPVGKYVSLNTSHI